MLTNLCTVKVSWAKWERCGIAVSAGYGFVVAFAPTRRALLFYPFIKKERMIFKMKNVFKTAMAVLLAVVMAFCGAGCGKKTEKTGLWEQATYVQDKEFGNGSKTIQVEVKAEEKSVTFTLKTDCENLAAALLENKLAVNDTGAYGLYLKTVNGITADYDKDKSYWAFYKNGEYLMTGADTTPIADNEHYELVYTK